MREYNVPQRTVTSVELEWMREYNVTQRTTAKIDSKYDELRSPWHSCRAELVRCTEFHGETRSPFDSVTYKAQSTCVTV